MGECEPVWGRMALEHRSTQPTSQCYSGSVPIRRSPDGGSCGRRWGIRSFELGVRSHGEFPPNQLTSGPNIHPWNQWLAKASQDSSHLTFNSLTEAASDPNPPNGLTGLSLVQVAPGSDPKSPHTPKSSHTFPNQLTPSHLTSHLPKPAHSIFLKPGNSLPICSFR